MMYIIKCLGVALSVFLVDVCWAKYFLYVAKHRPLPSAIWGSMIIVFAAFTTINYINDRFMLIPAFIGGFLGTYITILKEKKKSQKNESN